MLVTRDHVVVSMVTTLFAYDLVVAAQEVECTPPSPARHTFSCQKYLFFSPSSEKNKPSIGVLEGFMGVHWDKP
jgi:hypothetical protein